ncbi:MAG: DUF2281 domain-containing protein [Acidobacteria bacterium]|nr:DUF2281 domain-containing protein [Acidobacteriota bacterium]MBI3423758.1 DUF2281 domain-containing protein [Acidobacteriota bacterium]
MSSMLTAIQEKVRLLSPQRQAELVDFADFLLSKEQAQPPTRGLAFDWVIDPAEPPEPLSSVELQHQATAWMVEMAEKHLEKK